MIIKQEQGKGWKKWEQTFNLRWVSNCDSRASITRKGIYENGVDFKHTNQIPIVKMEQVEPKKKGIQI